MTELHYLSASEIADRYRRRELSPVEVTASQLSRIDALNPTLNAFVHIDGDRAMAQARAAEAAFVAGIDVGPLQGIPVGLKDLVDQAGVPTTAGSTFYDNGPAEANATLTNRLLAGGAIILGKQHMHEFAADGPFNRRHGRASNPWNVDRYTGGSSSGSGVAVAAGLGYGAIGSDTAGSIRLPAAYCGTVGLKATYGRVPVTGSVTLSWTLDHLGPLTRTVRDAAAMLAVIAGHDPADPLSLSDPVDDYHADLDRGVAGLRIGVPVNHFFDRLDPDVERAVRAAAAHLAGLGARVSEIEVPYADEFRQTLFDIMLPEASAFHDPWFEARRDDYGKQIGSRLAQGREESALTYVLARRKQMAMRQAMIDLMRDLDLILTPTVPVPAFPPEQVELESAPHRVFWTGPFNVVGFPAISVPCGFSTDGLPIGLHLAGRPLDERTVLRAANAYEQTTDWHTQHPAL